MTTNQYDIIVIGGGLGGLTAGALLARNDLKVLVLEKNQNIGGGLQNFSRDGISYDTGMHVMGGWHPNGTLDRITKYLGIRNRLQLRDCDQDCMDEITCLSDCQTYTIPAGKRNFIKYLSRLFPQEQAGIEKYVESIERITDSFDLYNLRPYSHNGMTGIAAEGLVPADTFINDHVKDNRLRSVLSYINGLYGGESGRTPAFVHALIAKLYMNGSIRFAGGSAQLAHLLSETITNAGGKVMGGHEVDALICDGNRHATSIRCKNGKDFTASRYIWAAHPNALLSAVTPGCLTKAYTRRISSIKPTCSAFNVYIELKPERFRYINHTCYIHDSLDDSWNLTQPDCNGIPSGFMYMTPPEEHQGDFASTMLITALMSFDTVNKWSDSSIGHRPQEYNEWKQQIANGLVEKISKIRPELKDSIKSVHTSSPLTIRDYFNAPAGSIYGFSKDCNNILESQLPIVTKIDNLYLTGQCNNLHGICGVPLTAITTAEAVLYPRTIIDQL